MTFSLNGMTNDEKFSVAEEYINVLLPIFPPYSDFRISDVVEKNFDISDQKWKRVWESARQIEQLLRDEGYLTTGNGNILVKLTPNGRKAQKMIQSKMGNNETFASKCDRVLQFLTSSENRSKSFNSIEIVEPLEIDVETIDLIASKFHERGLINLSSTGGHYNFHLKNKAYIFALESSFEKENKSASIFHHTTINTVQVTGHGNFVNVGSIVESVINNTTRINNQGNNDIATAIEQLAKSVAQADDIGDENKKEYLEQINTLSEQALLPENQRLPKSTLKPIITLSLGALNAVASVAQVWSVWGPTIKAFFLPGVQ